MWRRFHQTLWLSLLLIVLNLVAIFYYYYLLNSTENGRLTVVYEPNAQQIVARDWANCSLAKCLYLRKCLLHPGRRLSVYVQPLLRVVDKSGAPLDCAEPSIEFLAIREILLNNPIQNENDPEKACLILPGIDTLSLLDCPEERIIPLLDAAKSLLPARSNLLLLNFIASTHYLIHPFPYPAIFASAQHSRNSFRPAIDLAIPLPNSHIHNEIITPQPNSNSLKTRPIDILVIFEQKNGTDRLQLDILRTFEKAANLFRIKFGVKCSEFTEKEEDDTVNGRICNLKDGTFISKMDKLIRDSKFFLISDAVNFPQMLFWHSLEAGTIPVILSDHFIQPFQDAIDWSRFSFHFFHSLIPHIPELLHNQTAERIEQMRRNGAFIFQQHLSSLESIVDAILAALETRIVPGRARTRAEWNFGVDRFRWLPIVPAKCQIRPDERQTITLLSVNGNLPKRLLEFLHAINLKASPGYKLLLFCMDEECNSAEQEMSQFSSLPFKTFQIPSSSSSGQQNTNFLDLLDNSIRQYSASSGPAVLLLNLSHSFWQKPYNTPANTIDEYFLEKALKIWADNCHAMLLFPMPHVPPTTIGLNIFANTPFAIAHKYFLIQFLQSSPFHPSSSLSCTSTRIENASGKAGSQVVALCQLQHPSSL